MPKQTAKHGTSKRPWQKRPTKTKKKMERKEKRGRRSLLDSLPVYEPPAYEATRPAQRGAAQPAHGQQPRQGPQLRDPQQQREHLKSMGRLKRTLDRVRTMREQLEGLDKLLTYVLGQWEQPVSALGEQEATVVFKLAPSQS